MVRRPLLSLIPAVAFALGLTMALAGFRPVAASDASFSKVWSAEGQVRVQWVLRAEDLIACQTAAPEMRRAWRDYGERLRITTYLVGRDTALARSFLRHERLASVELVAISDQEFTRSFAQRFTAIRPGPLVVLTPPGGPAVAYEADVRRDTGRLAMDGMMRRLNMLFQAPGSRLGAVPAATSGIAAGGE